jgi:YVTN family beta-propeller protein
MLRRLVRILTLTLLLCPWACVAEAAERVYVLSQAGAALTEIAVEDGKAGASIALDKAPAAMALSENGSLAYVTHPDLSRVSVVDLARRAVVKSLPVAGSPFGIAVTRSGRLYVGDWNGAHVSVLGGGGAERTIPVGRAPAHLMLSSDEKRLFVANRESDSVSVVRTSDDAVEATIAVGRAPFAMALSPDGGRLFVGDVQAGTVSVIDTAALAVVETLASGAMPYGAAVTPDGLRALVTNQQAGTVAVLGHHGEKGTIKVGGYPEGVAIGAGGTQAYVANWFSDDVSVLDLSSDKEVRRIKCPAGPRAIAVIDRAP